MRLMEVGTKALGAGNRATAYDMFAKAYDMYSLFWGLNMNLIDLTGVKQIAPDVYNNATATIPARPTETTPVVSNANSKSTVRRLGDWVKNAVNCCIE